MSDALPLALNMPHEKQAEQSRATQDMVGNMEEVVDSMRETAGELSERVNNKRELAEACLEQSRNHARHIDEMDERHEARYTIRDAERKKKNTPHKKQAEQSRANQGMAGNTE